MSPDPKNAARDWADFQAAVTNPPKDQTAKVKTKTGADYSYSYASLEAILAHVRPLLATHGFGVTQDVWSEPSGGGVSVRTTVRHVSGEVFEFGPLFLPSAADPQSMGSATTYARRYAICAALNIAAETDDDARSVSKARKNSGSGASGKGASGSETSAQGAPSPAGTEQGPLGPTHQRDEDPAPSPNGEVLADLWAEAMQVFGTETKGQTEAHALKRAREMWPTAGITKASQIGTDQLRSVIESERV